MFLVVVCVVDLLGWLLFILGDGDPMAVEEDKDGRYFTFPWSCRITGLGGSLHTFQYVSGGTLLHVGDTRSLSFLSTYIFFFAHFLFFLFLVGSVRGGQLLRPAIEASY